MSRDRRTYKVTRWSIPWLALIPLIGWELWTIQQAKPGGPLSHVVWWALGDLYSVRWWLLGWPLAGFLLWAAVHFLLQWPGPRELWLLSGAGFLVGLVGLALTR